MILRNATPLAVFTFSSIDEDGDPIQVVVTKGTFDIDGEGQIRLAAVQAPIRTREEFWQPDKPSSLRFEDDLAPFKPSTDVIVHATAHAPGGKRAEAWTAGIRIGEMQKRIRVTGPRVWVFTPLLGWALNPIVPVRYVPVRYELAFGGGTYEKNPVGVGFVDPRTADKGAIIPAPQILSADGRAPEFGKEYPVEGFSALAKSWQPRRARGGTFDAAWADEARKGPVLPADFDAGFWNASHPDLLADGYLRGDEEVVLEGLRPDRETLGFRLPGFFVAAAITDHNGFRQVTPTRLDTVLIDAERMRAELVFRASAPISKKHGVSSVQIHLLQRPS